MRASRRKAPGGDIAEPIYFESIRARGFAQEPVVVAERRLRRQRPQRGKDQGDRGTLGSSGGTHLLPWGCHTIMELVLAALPVETTGALLRTGATAEIAAILTCSSAL